jgi:addiction module HigA family antidote
MFKLKNIYPGEVLLEEFLLPINLSQTMLVTEIYVSRGRINELVHGKRRFTADTDLRLSRALGTSEGFWLWLQTDFDREERKLMIKSELNQIHKIEIQNIAAKAA